MLSFVVPAFNEELLIGRTIDAMHSAARSLDEPYEIVVADDASTDRTAEIARAAGARVVTVSNRQIAATRNSGARASTGDMIIFVDADTAVSTDAVRAAIAAMRAGAAGGGCAIDFEGRLPLYARVLLKPAIPLYRLIGLAAGCFLFCTRRAFDASGGFDETLFAGEEAIMSRAIRRQGRFVILKERVVTSGRKVRTHSASEILGIFVRFGWSRGKLVRQREGLDLWYGERRPDPDSPNPPGSSA